VSAHTEPRIGSIFIQHLMKMVVQNFLRAVHYPILIRRALGIPSLRLYGFSMIDTLWRRCEDLVQALSRTLHYVSNAPGKEKSDKTVAKLYSFHQTVLDTAIFLKMWLTIVIAQHGSTSSIHPISIC